MFFISLYIFYIPDREDWYAKLPICIALFPQGARIASKLFHHILVLLL